MELTYDGALVMPSNYVVVDENEMTYIEGGASRINFGRGTMIIMSKRESQNLQYYLTQASTLGYGVGAVAAGMAALLTIPTAGLGSIIAGSIGIVGVSAGVYFNMMENSLAHHTTNNGVIVNISNIAIFWSVGL